MDGISWPSTKDSAAARIQYAAGAAKGNRRRAKSGSTRTAIGYGENHMRRVRRARAVRQTTSSMMAATPMAPISSSNQYSRANVADSASAHALNVSHGLTRRLLPE